MSEQTTDTAATEDARVERICDAFGFLFDALDLACGDEPGTSWEDRSHLDRLAATEEPGDA